MDSVRALVDLLSRLTAMDTTSGIPSGPAMALLAEALEARGCRVAFQETRIRGVDHANLVAVLGPPEPEGLLLSGHVDTVPFRVQPGWTRDPLALTERGGRVYGRGVADMKAFLAQCVVALDLLGAAPLRRPVVLAFTAEEEVGCLGGGALAPALKAILAGPLGGVPLPRLGWIGEPTGWARHHAHKGIVQCTVRARGRGGHSSLPARGVNAIQVAARAVAALGALQEALQRPRPEWATVFPEAPSTTLNVGTIHGGTADNMIPEECAVGLSYRPLPGEDPREVLARIDDLLAGVDLRDHAGGAGRASLALDPDPLVVPGILSASSSALLEALDAELGPATPTGAPYATDGGHLGPLGLDVVICGPGELAEAHQPDESLGVTDLHRGPALIAAVCRRLLC